MGVKNLGKLIKTNPIKDPKINTIIIDGSNVTITFIQSMLSGIRENIVGGNIIETFNFIVGGVSKRILNLIDRLKTKFNTEEIFFIIDSESHRDMEIDGTVIDIKAREHEQRQHHLKVQRERLEKELENDELEKERRFFEFGSNYMLLLNPIYDLLSKSIKISCACYEADYTISCIALGYTNSLVVSLDSDFFIMCCEEPTVFIFDFQTSKIFNPYSEWKRVLESNGIQFSNLLIYRLAPLFGNDYTSSKCQKQGILDASDPESLKFVFQRDEIPPKRKKKLSKLKSLISYQNEIITIEELDSAVQLFSETVPGYEDFSNNYRMSLKAYEFLYMFGEDSEYVPKNDGSSKIERIFPCPKVFVVDDYEDL